MSDTNTCHRKPVVRGIAKITNRREPWNLFTCETCDDHPQMDGIEEFKKHLAEKHNIADFKGSSQPMAFLDGSGFWEHINLLIIRDVEIIQDVGGPTRIYGADA